MMLNPPPSVNKSYSLVMAEESQRLIGKYTAVEAGSSTKSSNMNDVLVFFSGEGKFP